MNTTAFEPIRKEAFMAAILSALIPIDLKFSAAVGAFKIIDGFAFYKIKMTVPPGISALVAAEAFLLPLCYLPYFFPTVLTIGCFTCELRDLR
jgi:hypothetical protein